MQEEYAHIMQLTRRDSEIPQSAAEQAKPAPERRSASVVPTEAAVVPNAGRPADQPVQRHRPSSNPQHGINADRKRGAEAAEAQDKAGHGPQSASHWLHAAPAASQAHGNWLPRPEDDQREAWQGASRDVKFIGDVQVRRYTYQ